MGSNTPRLLARPVCLSSMLMHAGCCNRRINVRFIAALFCDPPLNRLQRTPISGGQSSREPYDDAFACGAPRSWAIVVKGGPSSATGLWFDLPLIGDIGNLYQMEFICFKPAFDCLRSLPLPPRPYRLGHSTLRSLPLPHRSYCLE